MSRDTAFMCINCKRTRLELIHIHKNSLCTVCYNNKKMEESNRRRTEQVFASIEKNVKALLAHPTLTVGEITDRIASMFKE